MAESILKVTKIITPGGVTKIPLGFDDAQGAVASALSGAAQWTIEGYRANSGFLLPFLRHDQTDYAQIIIQMPHRKKFGALKSLHVHTIPMATWTPAPATKDVRWSTRWHWFSVGEALPDIAGWAGTTPVITLQTLAPTDQYKHKIHTLLSDISHPNVESASSILVATITRTGQDGGDTYDDNKTEGTTGAANLGVLYFDAHYESDRGGTYTETA
jgi:hypothetical protein